MYNFAPEINKAPIWHLNDSYDPYGVVSGPMLTTDTWVNPVITLKHVGYPYGPLSNPGCKIKWPHMGLPIWGPCRFAMDTP